MLVAIYTFISKNKWSSFLGIGIIFLFLIWASSKIQFQEDISKVLPQNQKTSITSKVIKQLNFSDKISVIIQGNENTELAELQEVASEINEELTANFSNYISQIQGIVNDTLISNSWDFIYEHLPLFLEEKDYQELTYRLEKDSLATMIKAHYRTMLSPSGIVAQNFIRKDPFGLTFNGLKKLQNLNVSSNLTLIDGFLTAKDKKEILFFISPKYTGNETEHNAIFAEKLSHLQNKIQEKYPNIQVDFFGSALLAVANAHQIKTDILTTVVISLVVLYLILAFFYQNIFVPLIAFIPSLLGVLAALAFLYFFKGSISAISISIGAVLLGVTVDYSLHILTHYNHANTTAGLYKIVTNPILLSSSTTAISFFCLLFTQSEVMNDLGVFASIGIMVSALFALILIPHLYRGKKGVMARKTLIDKMAAYPYHQKKILIFSGALLIVVSLFFFGKVHFNSDISSMNYMPENYLSAQHKLENLTDDKYKSIYAVAYGNSLEEALQKNEILYQNLSSLKEKGDIKQFSSVGNLIFSQDEQQKRIHRWNNFWQKHSVQNIENQFVSLGEEIGFKPSTYQMFFEHLQKSFQPIHSLDEYKELAAIPLSDFISEKNNFFTIGNLLKIDISQREKIIQNLENQFVVIDRKNLNETFLGELKDNVLSLASYSSIAVIFILFLYFKRIELVLLTFSPILATTVVSSALMYWLGIEFNVFSMIVCTLVLGHAVDFSIFMSCALQKQYTYGKDDLPTYKVSVLLACITTLLAIGTLIFAKHPALQSIASVSLIGLSSALLITFIMYPAIYKWFIFNRPRKGISPTTLVYSLISCLSIAYYGIGSFILSNLGNILIKISPKSVKWIRILSAKFFVSVLATNPFVKKKYINRANISLDKPVIFIANHTSWLDTLVMGMISPQTSYIVNDWVYNSPIFGKYVQKLGGFPASKGVEEGLPIFQKNIEEGVSIVIFPEGTRSATNAIGRFHKGAFYLAEQLGLDIVPIYIHGNAQTNPKGDFIIYHGHSVVVSGEPISLKNNTFGGNYSERCKKINAYFREQFSQIRKELEDVDYFKEKLMLNYLYMENSIRKIVRKEYTKTREMYLQLNEELPKKEAITLECDDYGQLAFLLTISEPKREITAIIPDDEKRAVAQQSYLTKICKLKFVKN
ncbi:MAG: MMPL family transporter [Capnocytophaga sp.]|nr:MMPL family transporter [Capnocytophaga sp.]